MTARVIAALLASSAACVAIADSKPIYNRTYTIEQQVDDVRWVEEAIMRNTAQGDWIMEFMADRTDMP